MPELELSRTDAARVSRFLAPDALWSQEDISAWLGCSRATMSRLVSMPGFPKPLIVGGSSSGRLVRYRAADVKTFIEQNAA